MTECFALWLRTMHRRRKSQSPIRRARRSDSPSTRSRRRNRAVKEEEDETNERVSGRGRNRSSRRQRDENIKKNKRYAGKEERSAMYTPSSPSYNMEGYRAERLENFGNGFGHHHGNYPQHPHSRTDFVRIQQTQNFPHFHQNYRRHQTFRHDSNSRQYRSSAQGYNWNYDQPVHYNRGHNPRYNRNADYIYHPRYYTHSVSPERRTHKRLNREGMHWFSPIQQSPNKVCRDVTSKDELLTKIQCDDLSSAPVKQDSQIKETLEDCVSVDNKKLRNNSMISKTDSSKMPGNNCESHLRNDLETPIVNINGEEIYIPLNDCNSILLPSVTTKIDSIQEACRPKSNLSNNIDSTIEQKKAAQLELSRPTLSERKDTGTESVKHCRSYSQGKKSDKVKIVHPPNDDGNRLLPATATQSVVVQLDTLHKEDKTTLLQEESTHLEPTQQIRIDQKFTEPVTSNTCTVPPHYDSHCVVGEITSSKYVIEEVIVSPVIDNDISPSIELPVVSAKSESTQQAQDTLLLAITALLESAQQISDVYQCTKVEKSNSHVDIDHVTTPPVKHNRTHIRTNLETNESGEKKRSSSRSSRDTAIVENERSQLAVAQETNLPKTTTVDTWTGNVATPAKSRRSHHRTSSETNKSIGKKTSSSRSSEDTAEVEDERSQLEVAQETTIVQKCAKIVKSHTTFDTWTGNVTTLPGKLHGSYFRTYADANKSSGKKTSSSRSSEDTAEVENERSQLELAQKTTIVQNCAKIVKSKTIVDTGNVTTPGKCHRSNCCIDADTNKSGGKKTSSSRSRGDTAEVENERSQLELAQKTTIVQKCAKIVKSKTNVDTGNVTTPGECHRSNSCTDADTNKSGGKKISSSRSSGDTAVVVDETAQLEMAQKTTIVQKCAKIVKSKTNVDTGNVTTPGECHRSNSCTDADTNKSGGKKISSSRSSGDTAVVVDETAQLEMAQKTTIVQKCAKIVKSKTNVDTGNVTTPGECHRSNSCTDADTNKSGGKKISISRSNGDTAVVVDKTAQLEMAQKTTIVQKCAKIVKSKTNVDTGNVTTPGECHRSNSCTDADTNKSGGKKISISRSNEDTAVVVDKTAQLEMAQEITIVQKCAKIVESKTNGVIANVTPPPVKSHRRNCNTDANIHKSSGKKTSSSRSSGDTAVVVDERSQLEVAQEITIMQKCAKIVKSNNATTPLGKGHRSYRRTSEDANKSSGKKISSSQSSGDTALAVDETAQLEMVQVTTIMQKYTEIVNANTNVNSGIATTPSVKRQRSHCRTSKETSKSSGKKISRSRDTAVLENERAQVGLAQQKCTEIIEFNTNVDACIVTTPVKHQKSTCCEGPEATYKTSSGKKLSTQLELDSQKYREQHSHSSKPDNVTTSGSLQVVTESKKLQQIEIPSELKESVRRNECDSQQKKMEPIISNINMHKSDVITPFEHHSCQSLKDIERRRKTTKEEEVNSMLNIDEVNCMKLIQKSNLESSLQSIESLLSIENISLPPMITQLGTDQTHQRKHDSRLSEVVSNYKKIEHLTEKNKSNMNPVDEKCYTKRQNVIANSDTTASPSVEPNSSKHQHKTRRGSKDKAMNVKEKYEEQGENLKKRKRNHPSYSKLQENKSKSRRPHKKNSKHDLDTNLKLSEQKKHDSTDREHSTYHSPEEGNTILDKVTSHDSGPSHSVSNDVVDRSSVFMSYDDWVEQGMPCTKKMKEETQSKIACNKPSVTKRLSLALFGNSGKLRRKIVDSATDTQLMEQCLENVDDSFSNIPLHEAHIKSHSNETLPSSNPPPPELNGTLNVIHNDIPFELPRREISESAQTTGKDPVNQSTISELTKKCVEYNLCSSAEDIPGTSISFDTLAPKRRRSNSFSKYQAEKTFVILSMIDTQVPNSNFSRAQVNAEDMVNNLSYSESIFGRAEDCMEVTPVGSQENVGILTSDLPEVWPNAKVDMESSYPQSSHSAPSAIVPQESIISDCALVSSEHISLVDGLLVDGTMLPEVTKTEPLLIEVIDLTVDNDDGEDNSFKERFRCQASKTENICKNALLELLEHIITANDVVLKYNDTCSLVSKKVVSQMSRNATIQQEEKKLKSEISKIKKHIDFHTTIVQAMLWPGENLLGLLLDSRDSLREAQRMKSKMLTLDSIKYIYDLCSELPSNTISTPDQFDEINSTERILVTYPPQYNVSSSDNAEPQPLQKRNILHFKSSDQNQNVDLPGSLGHQVSHANMPPLAAIDYVKSIHTNFNHHPQTPPSKQHRSVQDRPSVICVNLDKFVQ